MVIVGLDIGTTSAKAVAYDEFGAPLGNGRAATPWRSTPNGVEMDAGALFEAARAALNQSVAGLDGTRISAVGVTSMAESGVVVDAHGAPVAPVIAWHDTRDDLEVAELGDQIGAAEFGARAGKPLRGQWSITKHLWLRRHHAPSRTARRRFNVAEWIVRGLGGDEVSELSLACRTGWFDVAQRRWWSEGLAFSEAEPTLLPPLVEAGQPVGRISTTEVAAALHGATLTVVGHDHQAAAAGADANRRGVELDSCGTAEALVRTIAPTLTSAQMVALAEVGITTDWSILPGHWSLLGGTEGGLAMQRVLNMLGVDRAGLSKLDADGGQAPVGRVHVRGLGTASLTIDGVTDGTSPGEVWRAAVQSATDDAAALHQAMNSIAGPSTEVVVTGGWANSRLFLQCKRSSLGEVRLSDVAEAGTRGAALFAARSVGALAADEHFPPRPAGSAPQPSTAARRGPETAR